MINRLIAFAVFFAVGVGFYQGLKLLLGALKKSS
jgi:hypothetical protein